jgi:D-arabinose 1-dehydrogenase-like Zn-dependent alcohol dehydrogenase
MKTRILYTDGSGTFVETAWDKPEPTDDEIEVEAIMTGICRSDIDMMVGKFGPLPLHMQGHEGLGQVTKVGKNAYGVEVGDYVATRGEPAFSDYYNVRKDEFIRVPSADPKYIIEPVACGINVVIQAMPMIRTVDRNHTRILILGSGFLAWIAYQTLVLHNLSSTIDIVGRSNKNLWNRRCRSSLQDQPNGQYEIIIDLKDDNQVLENNLLKPGGIWVLASEKKETITTNFGPMLWNATNIICPSPRTQHFYGTMACAIDWIVAEKLKVDKFWTKDYDRNTEWQQAFEDGLNRQPEYSRGYLVWSQND